MNQYNTLLVIKVHVILRIHWLIPNVLLFQDPSSYTTVLLRVLSQRFLLAKTVTETSDSLCLSWYQQFWGILVRYFAIYFFFFMTILRLWVLERKITKEKYHSYHIISGTHIINMPISYPLLCLYETFVRLLFFPQTPEFCLTSSLSKHWNADHVHLISFSWKSADPTGSYFLSHHAGQ